MRMLCFCQENSMFQAYLFTKMITKKTKKLLPEKPENSFIFTINLHPHHPAKTLHPL